MGEFNHYAPVDAEWEKKKALRPVVTSPEAYESALQETRMYFKEMPEYEDEQWKRITYLLKGIVKYETTVLKIAPPIIPERNVTDIDGEL